MSIIRLKLAWLVCLSLVLFAIGSDLASAQDMVAAQILSVDGPVEIRRAPSNRATLTKINFKPYDQLKAGDRITTGSRGRLILGLTDGSQAVVGERSVIEVKDLGSLPRELFHVLRGKTRVYIERLGGRPNPYRVNTPTAVIAVRGTLFDVIVKSSETEVFVLEGQVAVSGLQSPEQIVLLSAGKMTRVKRDQSPTQPAGFKPGRNDDAFRKVVDQQPVADIFDLQDRSTTADRRITATGRSTTRMPNDVRVATPTGRPSSNTPTQPTTGQRGPARKP